MSTFYDEEIVETEAQPQSSSDSRRRTRLLSTSTSTRSNNMTSIALDWTCMLATVAFLLVCLGFSWHTLQPTSFGGQRQVEETISIEKNTYPEVENPSNFNKNNDVPFLSKESAMASRNSPHSMAELNQVVSKTLIDIPNNDNEIFSHHDNIENEDQGGRLLEDYCIVDVTIDTICDGCDEWMIESGFREWPWCHSELTSMTFLYTGCPCGSWYTIDYGNSAWSNATGQTSLAYECWEPNFLDNETSVPPEVTCQDYQESPLDNVDIEYNQGGSVQWMVTAADDPSNIVGSGTVSIGEEYRITSSDPNTPLPSFLTLTIYGQDGKMIQSSTFPSAYCPGYPDNWYRLRYPQAHIVEVNDMAAGTVSTRDTLKEALWLNVTIDASGSPVPIRLTEMNMVANINAEPINLTDTVNGVELNGNGDGQWNIVTTRSTPRNSRGRERIHSMLHSRQEFTKRSKTMTMMIGPMTVDLYWRTRYTFFTTIIAEQLNNNAVQCNGFAFHEYIGGLQ